jgi:hypothetical protein
MNCVFEPAGEGVLESFDKDGFTAMRPLASLSTIGERPARAGVVRGFLRSPYRRAMWVGLRFGRRNDTPRKPPFTNVEIGSTSDLY